MQENQQAADDTINIRRRGFPFGRVVAVALVLGLAGWVGVRVQSAMSKQKTVALEREVTAKSAAELAAKPIHAKTVRGAAEQWQPVVPLEGSLAPAQEAVLGFKVPGRMSAVKVKVGDKVKAGALLASLDATEVAAQLAAAEAQVRAAEAQLALAADAERRTGAMVQTGSMAEAAGVQTLNQKALAAANVDAAKAQVGLVRANMSSHVLTAPFAGTVTKAPSAPGSVVGGSMAPNQFQIQDLSTLKVMGTVGDLDAALVNVGSEIEIFAEGGAVKGKVSTVLGAVDPATRRVPVEATLPNEGARHLLAGAFVRAQIKGGATIPVLRFPRDVLRPGSQDELMVVKNGVLSSRHVRFTNAPDGTILVRSGIDETEDVMVGPSNEAKDGDKVDVGAPEAASPAAPVAGAGK